MDEETGLLPMKTIEQRILLIRGHKVILDADLALLYGVQTKALNQAIRRNPERFPGGFLFRLTEKERQEVVTICDHLPNLKYSPTLPYAFTEHGAVMAASVLNSSRAVQVSVYVVRVFIHLRQMLLRNRDLAEKLSKLEEKLETHDKSIRTLAAAIRELGQPSLPAKRRRIGF